MKNIKDISHPKHKKSLRLGVLLVSTLLIASASTIVYATLVYERALNVNNAGGVTTGPGPTASPEVGFTPTMIMILAVSALVISLSIFGLLREASRHIKNVPGRGRSSSTGPMSTVTEIAAGPVSKPPEAARIGLPLRLPSRQEEDWEESPTKEEGEE